VVFFSCSATAWTARRMGLMTKPGSKHIAPVAQAFQPAGAGDFPVASHGNTGLESPVNPQTGMSALHQLAPPTQP
jgi:hypothetical protein